MGARLVTYIRRLNAKAARTGEGEARVTGSRVRGRQGSQGLGLDGGWVMGSRVRGRLGSPGRVQG